MSEGPLRLGALDESPLGRPSWCAGALLSLTHDDFLVLTSAGVRFATLSKEIPRDGKRHDARVHCDGEEMTLQRDNTRYTFTVCGRCADLEAANRAALRDRLGAK